MHVPCRPCGRRRRPPRRTPLALLSRWPRVGGAGAGASGADLRAGMSEQEALHEIRAVVAHPAQLFFFLDALDDGADTHAVADLEELLGDEALDGIEAQPA